MKEIKLTACKECKNAGYIPDCNAKPIFYTCKAKEAEYKIFDPYEGKYFVKYDNYEILNKDGECPYFIETIEELS
jgi:hypothetical protein